MEKMKYIIRIYTNYTLIKVSAGDNKGKPIKFIRFLLIINPYILNDLPL